ncbi:hypothetical protein A8709_27255 [Paenibacillus pectinilyticus]|uniref:HTH merR-type domain-containing protein n=1 Tax=Paenibacillus pectinilyticus TaxID=512399 RepID=A0A1C1A204_9BACL|nr:MerR family transcriptional regulator [Paenibacillus pectinilyticus]OCT14544.1 hypothetical protein A8709_27255 [Paenibacillus pectinilyticus]
MEDITARLGITARTLHYYEEIGLLGPVTRTVGGHRLFDEPMVERIGHILRLKQQLGVSLQGVGDILQAEEKLGRIRATFYEEGHSDEEKDVLLEEASDLLRTLISQIDDKIVNLQAIRQGFEERLEKANRLRERT